MLLSLFNYCINFGIFPDAVPVNPSSCCLSPFHLSYVAVSRPCCLSEFNLKRALLEKSEEQLPKKLLASCLPTVVYSLMWNFSASFSYFRSRGCFWQDQLVTKIPWLEQSTCKEMGGSWWWGFWRGVGVGDRSGESPMMAHPTHNFCLWNWDSFCSIECHKKIHEEVLKLTVKGSHRQAYISNIQISCFLL